MSHSHDIAPPIAESTATTDHTATDDTATDDTAVDVAVIGGGPAGLSAALALGRSKRTVVVIDAGEPRNAPAAHMHGVLGHDGRPPLDFLRDARVEVARYGVRLLDGRAVGAQRLVDGTFRLELAGGTSIDARRLLVTSGLSDQLPAVVGLRERWGRDVVHCPYCHGWEVRDTTIVVIADNPFGAHSAMLFSQLSSDVSLLLHAGGSVTADERHRLAVRGIPIVERDVAEVLVGDDRVVGVRMVGGDVLAAQTIAVPVRTVAESPVLAALGLAAVDHPMGAVMGATYVADATGRTDVDGVFAAGNVVDPMATVPAAMAAGYRTGAMINADLIESEVTAAMDAAHASAPVMDESFWDEQYRGADRIWSGQPNPTLVAEASHLTPGRALDVGAGEGADAIWLAAQGWDVVAVDISSIALERGRQQAATLGESVANRITWVHADVLAEPLPVGPFDLVTVQYVHVASADRAALFPRCFDAVAVGGRALVVAHHPSDMHTSIGRPRWPGIYSVADELTEQVDERFAVRTAEARPRATRDRDGRPVTLHDMVFVAERTR